MYEEYDWFLAEVRAQGGSMNTDFATLNFVTQEELDKLEDRGIIGRIIEYGLDIIFTPEHMVEAGI